jgi:hypothetical protein
MMVTAQLQQVTETDVVARVFRIVPRLQGLLRIGTS